MKKNVFKVFLAASIIFMLFASCSSDDGSSDSGDNTAGKDKNGSSSNIVVNTDDEVRAVFTLTNEFRMGSEAYYLNEDNSSTTSLVGQLAELTLDDDLCRAATVRAQELLQSFSHTRPNGKNCSSVLEELSISYSAFGENIAVGSSTGARTFEQWKEDNEDYNGQGHRRNMLGRNFTRIGIAYIYDAGSRYKYYWCMILAR